MAKITQSSEDDAVTPTQRGQPSTVPHGAHHSDGLSHIFIMLGDIKKDIGGLETEVKRLIVDVNAHSTKIGKLSDKFLIAATVIAVVMVLGGFFLDHEWQSIWDTIRAMPASK